MHLDTATVALITAILCLTSTAFTIDLTLTQEARINRLEASIKAACAPTLPSDPHTLRPSDPFLRACAELSLPLKDQVSFMSIFQPGYSQ